MSAVLDTHTVLWYLENSKELSTFARSTIESAVGNGKPVHVSVISVIEAVYLAERSRIPSTALLRLRQVLVDSRVGLTIVDVDTPVADPSQGFRVPSCPICPIGSSRQPRSTLGFR